MALTYGFCLGEEGAHNTAGEFAGAFHAAFGDGAAGMEITPVTLMTLEVGEGLAMAGGYWLKLDDPEQLTAQASDNHFDRWDCVLVRVDLLARSATLELVKGLAGAIPEKYVPVRNDEVYELPLAHVLIRMGATQILASDITQAEEAAPLQPMDTVSNGVIQVYNFLNGGIDQVVEGLEEQAQDIMDQADKTIEEIEEAMQTAAISKPLGEVEILLDPPTPAKEWLPCDGTPVPQAYPQISALVGETMPDFPQYDSRFSAWMYAGQPTTKHPKI